MTAADTEFYRAFAGRVRQQLATPEGSPTMETTATAETTKTAVPATFQDAPDAPCEAYTWCTETGMHVDHFSRWVSLPTTSGTPPILNAHMFADDRSEFPELNFDPGHDDWREYTSGDQLRADVAKVRAHLARLDAFADQYDALREAGGQAVEIDTPDPAAIRRVQFEAQTLSKGSAIVYKQYGDLLRVAFDPDNVTVDKARELVATFVSPEAAELIDVPARFEDAEKITAPGARGALLAAYLYTPTERESGEADSPTYLTVYGEPSSEDDMNLEQAREFRARVAGFLPKLDAMIAAMPGAAVPPAPSGKTWTITTERGVKVSGYLPPWTTDDPTRDNVPANRLQCVVEDVLHVWNFDGQTVNVDVDQGSADGRYVGPADLLPGGIWLQPYSEDPAERVPVVNLEVLDGSDDWIHGLDPAGVADLASKLRAQADRLDFEVRPMLIAAREDWAANGGNH